MAAAGTSVAVAAVRSMPPPAAVAVADPPETRPPPRSQQLVAVAEPAAVAVAELAAVAVVVLLVAGRQPAVAGSPPLPLLPIGPIVQIRRFVDVDTSAALL